MDIHSSRLELDQEDGQFEDDRGQDVDCGANSEVESEERKPFEGMREYAESTMRELLAIYGLASGELAKSVSKQPTPLNPIINQQTGGEEFFHLFLDLVLTSC